MQILLKLLILMQMQTMKAQLLLSANLAVDASGEIIGYVVEVLPSGFGGTIDLMVGVDTEGVVTGISILSLSESPGLVSSL